jgi:riboflavin kinase/FMN adenylyltransferase
MTARVVTADELLAGPVIATLDAVTIGVFDGLHLGHRRLIDETIARAGGGRAGLVSFTRHPEAILGGVEPTRLISPRQRAALLMDWGIKEIIELDTDSALLSISPEAFFESLRHILPFRHLVVGQDFRFGRNGAGTAALLRKTLGKALTVLDPVRDGEDVISSSLLRALLGQGDLSRARRLLGRHFAVEGRLTAGDGIGRTIGLPTMNLEPPPAALPNGVYAVMTPLGPGVAHLGPRPTLDRMERRFEVHLFASPTDADSFTRSIEIAFIHRLRGIEHFASLEELRCAVDADMLAAREALESP